MTLSNVNLQPTLENEFIKIQPLKEEDFEKLYLVASDPLIWEQHPNKERYKRDVFQNYFKGAIESKGAFLVLDIKTGEIIGCSRYYDYTADTNSILIGYTFIACSYWGKKVNAALKALMLNYIFQFVDTVFFEVGADNIRSQKAMEKLGMKKIGEKNVTYYGEKSLLNFIFEMKKSDWKG